jgi:thiol-disulfide isomerase/thioredoxin
VHDPNGAISDLIRHLAFESYQSASSGGRLKFFLYLPSLFLFTQGSQPFIFLCFAPLPLPFGTHNMSLSNFNEITSSEQFQSLLSKDLQRVSLINFWAPWAEPCKQMNEVVLELAKKYPQVLVLQVRPAATMENELVLLTSRQCEY